MLRHSPTYNEQFELPDGSYLVSDVQDFFSVLLQKNKTFTDNLPVSIHINKIENGITFEIKIWYYLKPLMPETMNLFGSTKNKIIKDKNGENLSYLEITEVVQAHIVLLSITIIKKIQEYCIHFFLINCLID